MLPGGVGLDDVRLVDHSEDTRLRLSLIHI